jgi:hypothetical protein
MLSKAIVVISMNLAMIGVASASESSFLRSLQDGPLGEGPSFARLRKTEVEVGYDGSRRNGAAETQSNELVGLIQRHQFGAAAGYRVNSRLKFNSFFTSQISTYEFDSANQNFSFSMQQARHEFGAGPIFGVENLVFGGSVSASFLESEVRHTEWNAQSVDHSLPSVVLPAMRVYGGIYTPELRMVFGFKTYAQERVNKEVTRGDGFALSLDKTRNEPGEIWFDTLVKATDAVRFGLSATVETLQQSNESSVEELEGFVDPAGKIIQDGVPRNRNRFSLGMGGLYTANDKLKLSSSLLMVQKSFDSPEFASMISENLGGYQINVGSILDIDGLLLKFSAGYQIPLVEHYEVTEYFHAPWAQIGERVRVEQPLWKFGLHASVPIE